MIRPALLAAVALFASGCAGQGGARGRSVDAEGWAPSAGAHEPARSQAVKDALRRAVEQGSGVRVSAASRVVNGQLVNQSARTSSRGVVKSYRLIEEARADGGVRVRIRAIVEPGPASRPWPAGTKAVLEGEGQAHDVLARVWAAAGGELAMDADQAEVVVKAELRSVSVLEPRVRPFVSNRVRATLKLSFKDGGELRTVSKEAAALGLDEEEASEKAADNAMSAAVTSAGIQLGFGAASAR